MSERVEITDVRLGEVLFKDTVSTVLEYLSQRAGTQVSSMELIMLADNEDDAMSVQEYLESYPQIHLHATYFAKKNLAEADKLINEVNGENCDGILAVMSLDKQKEFLDGNRQKLAFSIWMGIQEGSAQVKKESKSPILEKLKRNLIKQENQEEAEE